MAGRKRKREIGHSNTEKKLVRDLRKNVAAGTQKANQDLKNQSKEIKAERQRLFDVLETLPVMVCLMTPDYHVVFANRAFREKFGESNGRHCYEYCCGFNQPCPFCESFLPLKTGKPHHWEFTSPDGKTIIDAYDFPFTESDGSPRILEMDIDITERKKAEDALQKSEEKFAKLFYVNPVAMAISTVKDGVPVEINEAFLRLFGYSRKEVIGQPSFKTRIYADLSQRQEMLKLLRAQGSLRDYEVKLRPKDGSTIYALAAWEFITIGAKRYLLATNIDITDRKQAESALAKAKDELEARVEERTREATELVRELKLVNIDLKRSEAEVHKSLLRFEELFESSPTGFFILNRYHIITDANQTASQMLFTPKTNLYGKPFFTFVDPDFQRSIILKLGQASLDGKRQEMDLKMGKRGDTSTSFFAHLIIMPIKDLNDKPSTIRIAASDITARKKAEEALRESEEKFRTLVETSNEGIAIARPNGPFIYVNQRMADMLGYSVNEVLGKSAMDFCSEDWQDQNRQIRQQLHKGESLSGEFKFRRKDGSVLWSMYNASPMFNKQNEHIASFAMHTDITERKRVEEALLNSRNELAGANKQVQKRRGKANSLSATG